MEIILLCNISYSLGLPQVTVETPSDRIETTHDAVIVFRGVASTSSLLLVVQ